MSWLDCWPDTIQHIITVQPELKCREFGRYSTRAEFEAGNGISLLVCHWGQGRWWHFLHLYALVPVALSAFYWMRHHWCLTGNLLVVQRDIIEQYCVGLMILKMVRISAGVYQVWPFFTGCPLSHFLVCSKQFTSYHENVFYTVLNSVVFCADKQRLGFF